MRHLEEGALGLQGTGEVVGVGATQTVTTTGGASLLAVCAAHRQSSPQSQLHIDEGAGLSLIYLAGPQSAVKVYLRQTDTVPQYEGPHKLQI